MGTAIDYSTCPTAQQSIYSGRQRHRLIFLLQAQVLVKAL